MSNSLYTPELLAEFLRDASHPLIVLVGPTASGKTGFSLNLAGELPRAEIINADSRQLYRFLDIGTAKIRPEEMRGIPHHLIDVTDPKEEVTVAWYRDLAIRVIDDIHRRRGVPVLVGGSMLYVSAVIDGLELLPPADPVLRMRLEQEYDQDNGESLYRKLQQLDPETAGAFDRRNKVYVVRAMEIYEMTGHTPSKAKKKRASPYDLFIIGMRLPLKQLAERIDARIQQMFDQGWIEEVQSLLARGYSAKDPGMKSLGYREIIAAIESESPLSVSALAKEIASKTKKYAKRQMTWWKGDERIRWLG